MKYHTLYVRTGYLLPHKPCTWWMLSRWWWHKTSHTILAWRHSHTYTQVSLLTVQHDDYLLFTKRKWIILKVFILVVFILRRLVKRRMRRGESCRLSRGRGERGGGGGSGGSRGRHTQCNLTEILLNFCPTCLLFHFSKNVSIQYQSFFHHLL